MRIDCVSLEPGAYKTEIFGKIDRAGTTLHG